MVSGPHTSYWLTDFHSFPIYPSLPHYWQSLSLILFIASPGEYHNASLSHVVSRICDSDWLVGFRSSPTRPPSSIPNSPLPRFPLIASPGEYHDGFPSHVVSRCRILIGQETPARFRPALPSPLVYSPAYRVHDRAPSYCVNSTWSLDATLPIGQ